MASVTRAHGQGQPVLDVLAAKAAAFRLERKKAMVWIGRPSPPSAMPYLDMRGYSVRS